MKHLPFACMQAIQIQTDSLKVHYRLAQAYFNVGQYQQCHATCQAALEIKPGAKQLRQLCQLAADIIRTSFMAYRNHELDQAVATFDQAAFQQVSKQHGLSCFCCGFVFTSTLWQT